MEQGIATPDPPVFGSAGPAAEGNRIVPVVRVVCGAAMTCIDMLVVPTKSLYP
jgi:hypothetical protein